MSVHIEAYQTGPDSRTTLLSHDEESIREAIGYIRLTYNRENNPGRMFVDIDGKCAQYDPWFMTFHKWFGSGWCQIHNPLYYFTH